MDRKTNAIKPFWSWNDFLERDKLIRQINDMKQNGIEGFFMHARGGLCTKYMSDDWLDMIEACLDKADELDMQAWAYDENGWPSGFADEKVLACGEEHHQKSLCLAIEGKSAYPKARVIAVFDKNGDCYTRIENPKKDSLVFYYDVNPYYVDVFNKESIALFIKFTHEVYYNRFKERFGTSLKGFFTDEPQHSPSPWSLVFPEIFKKDYGYDLLDVLPALYFRTNGYEAVRNDFYTMVSRLMQESFIKQMYDWCTDHNCKLTGHMMCEDNLAVQIERTGGVMPCYEYFHEPGIDHLGRKIASPTLPKQLGSAAKQLGRKTLTETFALCGWDVSLNELKWIAQWQFLNGVTSLCPHLEGYSLKGCRKRDYPASLFTQLPWFDEVYSDFADYFTSLGKLLDSGTDIAPLLVVHPMQSAYVVSSLNDKSDLYRYSERFECITEALNCKHILHHYGDETIMSRHASVNGNTLTVGNCEYKAVLLPEIINLKKETVSLLLKFTENGGKVFYTGDAPKFENGRKTESIELLCKRITFCKNLDGLKKLFPECAPVNISSEISGADKIHITVKAMPNGEKLLYMINNLKQSTTVTPALNGKYSLYLYDPVTEKETQLSSQIKDGKTYFNFEFGEYASALIILKASNVDYTVPEIKTQKLKLEKYFDITSSSPNAITLDKCTYKIDGEECNEETAVINFFNTALALQRPCDVEMCFTFNIAEEFDFSSVFLCMEVPDKFTILINGKPYKFYDDGYYIDESIRKSNIGEFIVQGENKIVMSCRFTQSQELYYAKFTPGVRETLLNKLTYDTELESIYITGNFGVRTDEPYRFGERRCIHAGRRFTLVKPKKNVDITDITPQDFWFFSGKMELTQKITLEKRKNTKYLINFSRLNAPAAKIYINGKFAGTMAFAPFTLDVTEFLENGENKITVCMLSGNRNLLGPHHRPFGESYFVGPATFSSQNSWADDPTLPPWTDDYSFVLFGAEL